METDQRTNGSSPLTADHASEPGSQPGSARSEGAQRAPARISIGKLWEVRELSTVAILLVEIAFFGWYLWPEGDRAHPFLNLPNALLILKYSSIYGIAAVGAARSSSKPRGRCRPRCWQRS